MRDALAETLLEATVMDDSVQLTLADLCRACAVDAEQVIELVEVGLVDPCGRGVPEWRFTGPTLYRVRTALRLQQDLQVNASGAALALELLDEIKRLRRMLDRDFAK